MEKFKGAKFDVIKRYTQNPILTPDDMPEPCCAIYNSGVVKTPEGEYIMASRFEEPSKKQKVWISRSRDGINFTPDPKAVEFVCADGDREEYEEIVYNYPGKEIGSWYDPRINPVDGEYYITYCVGGDYNCRIAIGKTRDFKTIEHVSFPLHIQNRNAVLFPEKINNEYWMLNRPQSGSDRSGSIWIASSPDLKYWGNCRIVAKSEQYWENIKIGPAAPPIKTDEGWLIVYHGVFGTCSGVNYGGGVMLLDLEKPWKVVARCKDPILYVKEPYEMIGQVPNVIFPGSLVPEEDGNAKLYYGGADFVQCVAETKISDLIDICKRGRI